MKTQQKLFTLLILVITVFAACTQEEKSPFTLNGTIEGATEGTVIMNIYGDKSVQQDSATIKEGKFMFKGDYPEPVQAYLLIQSGDKAGNFPVFLENVDMNLTANVNDLNNATIIGGQVQEDFNKVKTKQDIVREEFNKEFHLDGLMEKLRSNQFKDKELMDEYTGLSNKLQAKSEIIEKEFINNNPASYYSLILIQKFARGKGPKEIENLISKLDPKLSETEAVKELRAHAEELATTDVGIENIIKVKNVNYKVDKKFDGSKNTDIVYLAVLKNDNICALQKDGTVQIINGKAEVIKSFKTNLNGKASAIAVGPDNQIYVLASIQKMEKRKVRGREYENAVPLGVECTLFNTNGKKGETFKLPDLITATGVRVVGDNLIVADYRQAKISTFDKTNGEYKSTISGMRPCCGILDFSINDKNEVLVANLGAFRVQAFDFSGKQIVAFGQRGKELEDFHGCCNPVSVAYLSNSAIVTVEKDPTRVKIYSNDGARQIAGIEELVKGCSYIPMIVDSKDNLFLASPDKGMVKCISMN